MTRLEGFLPGRALWESKASAQIQALEMSPGHQPRLLRPHGDSASCPFLLGSSHSLREVLRPELLGPQTPVTSVSQQRKTCCWATKAAILPLRSEQWVPKTLCLPSHGRSRRIISLGLEVLHKIKHRTNNVARQFHPK